MVLERVPDTFRPNAGPSLSNNNNNNSGGGRSHYDTNDFYWFRFILFTLLIVSPCFRAGYLWWVGGGRLRLRRDPETGRFIGIQYTPPMQNWFGMVYYHHDNQEHIPVHNRLTQDQVMSLPEITFHVVPQGTEYSSDNVQVATTTGEGEMSTGKDDVVVESVVQIIKDTQPSQQPQLQPPPQVHPRTPTENNVIRIGLEGRQTDDPIESMDSLSLHGGETDDVTAVVVTLDSTETVIESMDDIIELSHTTDQSNFIGKNAMIDVLPVGGGLDEEQPLESSTQNDLPSSSSLYSNLNCTVCSICIEEFEDGERIRLLPRCGHAFHTECILPWLCERQGCCPLCKMTVLGNQVEEEKEEENNVSPSANEQQRVIVEDDNVIDSTSSVNDGGIPR
jgi:hypothetical protein